MTLYLGENLKALRQMRGLTQEDLALMIGVTAQSVSKWERGETYPDITLLPVLAACFDVSTDALLGTDREKREREVQRYVDLYDNMALQDLHAVFLAYEQAVKDYPADARILVRYMELLLEEKDSVRDPDYAKTCRKLRTLYERIRDNCKEDPIRIRAGKAFLRHLLRKADSDNDAAAREQAEALIASFPSLADAREILALEACREIGKAREKLRDHAVRELMFNLQNMIIGEYCYDPAIPVSRKLALTEAWDAMLLLLDPDALSCKNGVHLIYNERRLGSLYYENGDPEKALFWFRSALERATAFDALPDAGLLLRAFEKEPDFREMPMRVRVRILIEKHSGLSEDFLQKQEMRDLLSS